MITVMDQAYRTAPLSQQEKMLRVVADADPGLFDLVDGTTNFRDVNAVPVVHPEAASLRRPSPSCPARRNSDCS